MDAGLRVSSAKLAELGLDVVHEQMLIKHGIVELAAPIKVRSLLMALHEPLVFLGLSAFGESSVHFRYGRPWGYKASILRKLLVDCRGELPISRKAAADVVTQTLRSMNFPLAGLIGTVAEWFLPRSGWHHD